MSTSTTFPVRAIEWTVAVERARWFAALTKNAEAADKKRDSSTRRTGVGLIGPSTLGPAVSAPVPVSSRRCPPGEVHDLIVSTFGPASDWAESVAWRESNCQPGARNGSSGSAGVFQLLRHDDLLRAACPELEPAQSWSVARCNVQAAKYLFDAAGISPWRL